MELKDLSQNTYAEIAKLNQAGALKLLLELHLADASSTVRRRVNNPEAVTFDGNAYSPANFKAAGFQVSRINQLDSVSIEYLTDDLHEDINAGYLNGASAKLIMVFTNLLSETNADLELSFATVTYSRGRAIVLQLAAENPSQKPSPARRTDVLHCEWEFRAVECPYNMSTVTGVTLSGSNPVQIVTMGHGLTGGESMVLENMAGITPTLNGIYTVTRIDALNLTLDGTNSSNYSGTLSANGELGFSDCTKILSACQERGCTGGMGCFPGLNQGGDRLAY